MRKKSGAVTPQTFRPPTQPMKEKVPSLPTALAAAPLSGAANTASLKSGHTDPSAGPLDSRNVMVIALTNDGGLRRSAEEVTSSQGAPAEPPGNAIGIETSIYDADDGSLICSELTHPANPGDMKTVLTDLVETLRAQLKKQGLSK